MGDYEEGEGSVCSDERLLECDDVTRRTWGWFVVSMLGVREGSARRESLAVKAIDQVTRCV